MPLWAFHRDSQCRRRGRSEKERDKCGHIEGPPVSRDKRPLRADFPNFFPLCFRPSAVRLWPRVLASLPFVGAPTWLHHTLLEALAPWQWRVPRDVALSLGGLAISPYPHTGLCKGMAERVPCASECQTRERGSTREPLATCTVEQGRRRMPCALFLSSLPLPTIAYQQICWGGGLIHYQWRAGDGFQPRLTPSVDMIDIASGCAKRTYTFDFWRNRCVNHHYFLICTQGKS